MPAASSRSETSGDSSIGRSVFERDGGAARIADLADELDQRLVAAERVRAQDGRARFFGLIEPHRGQRDGGGRAGAFGLELLPAPRGLRAGADLLAFRRRPCWRARKSSRRSVPSAALR